MRVYMRPIKMISMSEESGLLTPIKFQMKNEDKEYITVRIDNIILREEEKLAGNKMLIYRCQSEIAGVIKIYEIKYELSRCIWYIWKF